MQNDNATPRSAAAKANPRAASVRVKALPLSRAKSQRMHDLRIGEQPNYVDGDRKHLNRVLMPLRSLPAIHRENEALRGERGCQKKMKSNAAAVMSGIITFGHQAQVMFACLSDEQQDAAYVEVAERAAALLQTQLEGLVVHADESADHAHFMLRGYCDDGEPVSKRATYQAMSQLQDMVAEVLQHYCPDIERGNGKWDRIANGADYAETLSRSVIRLHQDLPHEIAALEATLQILVEEIAALQASAAKTRRHFEKMEARRDKTAKQLKTARTYKKRLAKKETALSELVIQCGQLRVELDAKDKALNSRETEADCRDKAHQADIMAHADMMAVEAEQFAAEHDALDAQWAAHVIEVRAQKAVAEAHAFALTAERERLAVEKAAHHADVVAHENMVAVEAEQFAAEYDALAVEWSRHMTEVRAHQAVAKAREVDLRLELERAAEDKRAFDAEMAVKAQAFERQQADIAVDEYLAELTRVYAEDVLAAALTKAEAADVARRNDEAAAVLAQSRATSAKQMEADAQARATDFKDLENEAKAHLKLVDAACSAAQSETAAAAKRLETAILAEVEAKAEAAKALQLRDQRHAEIDNAGNAQKLIDDARLRDLDATGKENAFVRQLITLEQGALAQDRAAHVEDLRRKRAGTDARKAALLIENERLAQVVELVHQAGLARRADEYAAEAAGSKAADAKREAVAAKENAAHFKDLVKDAETNLDILIFGKNEVMEAKEIAIAQRDAARVDETVARAEAAAALETRDARLAEIADAAAAQKQIDDVRQRDLAVASSVNEAAAQKVTARETAVNASQKGITSLCDALTAGKITIGKDGRLRMTDSRYVKAMPERLRVVLVPIVKTIIGLKLRLTERLAAVETRIRKIEDFLKRDDLTAEARVEAEDLRTPDWLDGVDDPS